MKELIMSMLYVEGKLQARRIRLRYLQKHCPDLLVQLLDQTSFAPLNTSIRARIELVMAECDAMPVCRVCSGPVKIKTHVPVVCSPACSGKFNALNPKHSQSMTLVDREASNLKRQRTLNEKYGVAFNSQRADVRKILSSNIKERFPDVRRDLITPESLRKLYVEDGLTSIEIGRMLECDYTTIIGYLNEYGIETRGGYQQSGQEREVSSFISGLGFEVISNKKIIHPMELDMFVPERNFAVEFNGAFWHSEANGRRDRTYHIRKSQAAFDKGIDLFHINSVDWEGKRTVIESMLKSKLGLNQRVGARKCKLVEVPKNVAREFCASNHIQGSCQFKFALGLELNGMLVAVATFGQTRFDRSRSLELLRFCSMSGVTVIGGLSKMVSEALRGFPEIVSYCDRSRSFCGSSYLAAGFELVSLSGPGYQYYHKKTNSLHNRLKFTKSRLKSSANYREDLSEREIMELDGFYRIWDCGQLKFRIKSNTK